MRQWLVVTVLVVLLLASLVVGIISIGSPRMAEHGVQLPGTKPKQDAVGVVYIYGPIHASESGLGYGSSRGSDWVIDQIHRMASNSRVAAVVLRINSPGGTVGATQEIYREVKRLTAAKHVVVSMADIGASGAYYISCGAEKIVCNEGSLVGSIGVIMTFPNMQGLFEDRLKMKWTTIKSGQFKDIGSMFREMSPEELALLQGLIDNTYGSFLDAVKAGRGKIVEEWFRAKTTEGKPEVSVKEAKALADKWIEDHAKGQVFTGLQAKEAMMVDEIGGFEEAKRLAEKMAGLPADSPVIGPPKSVIDQLLGSFVAQDKTSLAQELLPAPLTAQLEYMYRPGW